MEMFLRLASKRRLGFVTGTESKPNDDKTKLEMWETCNNMNIAWLTRNVSDIIKKFVMYVICTRNLVEFGEEICID